MFWEIKGETIWTSVENFTTRSIFQVSEKYRKKVSKSVKLISKFAKRTLTHTHTHTHTHTYYSCLHVLVKRTEQIFHYVSPYVLKIIGETDFGLKDMRELLNNM